MVAAFHHRQFFPGLMRDFFSLFLLAHLSSRSFTRPAQNDATCLYHHYDLSFCKSLGICTHLSRKKSDRARSVPPLCSLGHFAHHGFNREWDRLCDLAFPHLDFWNDSRRDGNAFFSHQLFSIWDNDFICTRDAQAQRGVLCLWKGLAVLYPL